MAMIRTALAASLFAAVATGALVTGAWAQGLPLPGQPAPEPPFREKVDCSELSVKVMQTQLEQLEAIEKTGPETIGLFCKGIETLSNFMEWKDDEPLPGAINDLAKELLHQNLTPRMIKAMCRQAQGEAGRNFRTEIGKLKDKLDGCKGI